MNTYEWFNLKSGFIANTDFSTLDNQGKTHLRTCKEDVDDSRFKIQKHYLFIAPDQSTFDVSLFIQVKQVEMIKQIQNLIITWT